MVTNVFPPNIFIECLVRRGCGKIRSDLENGYYAHAAGNPSALFRAIAESTEVMGGTSGAFTGVFLKAAASRFVEMRGYDEESSWKAAFVAGVEAVMNQGGAKVGDRTMVDALKPAADALEAPGGSVASAAYAARVGCEATKSMTKAKYGRSANVRSEKLLNQPDPGAYAVCLALEALVEAPHVDY